MSDQKIIIPFAGKKEADIDTGGVFSFIGFDNLRKVLEVDSKCSNGERITGFVIDNTGIKIRIDRITPVSNQ